jgi:hypothetical protein
MDVTYCAESAIDWSDYHLPCPSISSFDYEIDAGLLRTQFESGAVRQRRRYKHRPTSYALTWSGLTTSQVQAVEIFAQEQGYNWFYAPLITGQVGRWKVLPHLIRFSSNLSVSLQKKDRWLVTVSAEQHDIDMECMLEIQCDDIIGCLENTSFPPVSIDWTQFSSMWGNKARWRDPND